MATIYYDEPINNTLAIDNSNAKQPIESRNFSRTNDNYATVSGTIALDSSYPTGGYPVAGMTNGAAKFGLKVCQMAWFSHQGGYLITYDQVNDKVKIFQQSAATGALTEVPNATNLSAVPAVAFMAHGRMY